MRRPSETALARSGSSAKSAKYWNGEVDAELLALEQHRDERGGQHQRRGDLGPLLGRQVAEPVALGPVAELVVVLDVAEEVVAGQADRRPAVAPEPELRPAAGVDVGGLEGGGQVLHRAEVGVVPVLLAGDHRVEGVVEVVGPLGVDPEPADLPGADDPRVVQVALGDQDQVPAEVGLEDVDLGGQLLQER